MAQHGAYNDLQAFSHFCLAHCQAHSQWVWQRAKPLSKALDLTLRQIDTHHLRLKGVGSGSIPHLQSLGLGTVPSPRMVAIWVWHVAKPKGDSSSCSVNSCPIMFSTQLSQKRQVWHFTRIIPLWTRQVPSPKAVDLAAFQTLVYLDSVHSRVPLDVGSSNMRDLLPLGLGTQPSSRSMG